MEEREKAYHLQRIDCNCNNCGFMQRDLAKWKLWHDWHKAQEEYAFDLVKSKAIAEAEAIEDENMRRGMLYYVQ